MEGGEASKGGMWSEPGVGGGWWDAGVDGAGPGFPWAGGQVLQASQASRTVGREAWAGKEHQRTSDSLSQSLCSCSVSHLLCPSLAEARVRCFLRVLEQGTANEFSENEQ